MHHLLVRLSGGASTRLHIREQACMLREDQASPTMTSSHRAAKHNLHMPFALNLDLLSSQVQLFACGTVALQCKPARLDSVLSADHCLHDT